MCGSRKTSKVGKTPTNQPWAKELLGIEDLIQGLGCPEEVGFGPTNNPGQYGMQITVGPIRVMFLGDEKEWLSFANGVQTGIKKFHDDGGWEAAKRKRDPPDMDETVA